MVAEALSDRGTKVPISLEVDFSQSLGSGASATVTLATPASGKRIVVVGLFHVQFGVGMGSNTKVQFQSGSDDITGLLASNVTSASSPAHLSAGYMPDGHFWTEKDAALKMTVTNGHAATRTCIVDGVISYFEE